jgi:ubiquinone biosynthesis protein UbiJ
MLAPRLDAVRARWAMIHSVLERRRKADGRDDSEFLGEQLGLDQQHAAVAELKRSVAALEARVKALEERRH